MNTYESRRRTKILAYLLIVLLALPPGFLPTAMAANKRSNALTRDALMETFRNPQFSSAASNRFLFNNGPNSLLGGGGASFTNPMTAGYRGFTEPDTHWLTNDGKIEWFARDLTMPAPGLPLMLVRAYRGSVSSYDGPMGKEWDFNWNKRLTETSSTSNVTFHELNRSETYTYGGGSFTSPAGRYDSLVRDATPNPDEYTRTDSFGIVERYEFDIDRTGTTWYRLKTITDTNSNAVTFAYDAGRNLTKVTDTLSREHTLLYDANDRITKITDSASRDWIYGYDNGYLTSVRTPIVDLDGDTQQDDHDFLSGKTTTYEYDGSNRLTEISRPGDGATGLWKWAFDGSGKVTKHTRGGNDILLSYDGTNKYTYVTDREGLTTRYQYDDASKLITKRNVYHSGGSWETTWAYDGSANVLTAIFPLGNRVVYDYDGSGNVLSVKLRKDGSDNTPITWAYSYAANARLSTLTDPNGETWDFDYDGAGNLTHRTAPTLTLPDAILEDTIEDSWTYNGSGLVTGYTDPVGTLTAFEYSTVNTKPAYLIRGIADSGGLNLTTAYAYDTAGNVTSMTDPEGNATTYTVNALNQVVQAVEPGSVTRKTFYDSNDRVIQTQESNDTAVGNSWFVVDNQYDATSNLTKVIADVDGTGTRLTTTYAYDANDRLTSVITPGALETTYAYDNRDLVISTVRHAASSPNDQITVTAYDSNGNRTSVTDGEGNVTTYAYDLYDRLTRVTKPEGGYQIFAHDKNGNVTQQAWKNAGDTTLAQATYHFDEANRLYQVDKLAKKADLSTNLGDGTQTATMWRNENGQVLEHTGDVCGCSLYEHAYDAVGREITKSDPMGNLVLPQYDKNGRVTRLTREDQSQDTGIEAHKTTVVEMVYDSRGRMITRKEKLASTPTWAETVYFYGLRDQLTKVVDAESREMRYEHNEQLWTTKDIAENGAADVVTEHLYDADGRQTTYKAINATTGNQETIYTFDALGQLIGTEWPDEDSHVYTYDEAGRRISTTDPNGTVTVASYDDNGRLTAKAITLAANIVGATAITFGYDGMDRLTVATTDENSAYTSVVERTYNTLGKIETEKQVIDGYASGAGRTITYAYDVEGERIGVTYPVGGTELTYVRDDLGRLDKISRGAVQVVDYTFNGNRVIKKAYPESYGTLKYDYFGRLTETHHRDTDTGNTLAKFDLAYDKSHQITSQDKHFYDDVENTRITADTVDLGDQYAYDGAKRLLTVLRGVATADIGTAMATNVTNEDYADLVEYVYDETGNRTTRRINEADDVVYAYGRANQMTVEGSGVSPTHNDNGAFTGYGGWTGYYRYNHADQLARYHGGVLGGPVFTWHYDALGRQIARTKTGAGGATNIRTYYDGLHEIEVVQETSGAETHTKTRVYGERIDELLEYTNETESDVYYAHADHLGSVMLMADDQGGIAESYRYREFGETTVVDGSFVKQGDLGSDIGNWMRYTGRERALPGSFGDDWYFYRARVYRPNTGRFVQRDPLGYVDGPSQYIYTSNRPIILTDPLGLVGACEGPEVKFHGCCISSAYAWGETPGTFFGDNDKKGPVNPSGRGTGSQGFCEVDNFQVCCGTPPTCSTFSFGDDQPAKDKVCWAFCSGGNTPSMLCCTVSGATGTAASSGGGGGGSGGTGPQYSDCWLEEPTSHDSGPASP